MERLTYWCDNGHGDGKWFVAIDGNGEVKHNRLTLIMDAFIANARNPHKGKPTHG